MKLGGPLLWRVLFIYLVLLTFPAGYSNAQDWPVSNEVGPFSLGSVKITPTLKIGYEKIGLNFNLPLASGNAFDLSLRNAELGVGSVGILASIGDRFALFANAEATLKKNLVVATSQEPINAGRSSLDWTGSQFQQGQIEAGLIYRCRSDLSLVGGLRRTRSMMKLIDPRSGSGPIDFSTSSSVSLDFLFFNFSFIDTESQKYFGDFNTGIWMPFLGVQFTGLNCKASLIGSPVGWVQVSIPLRLQQTESPSLTFSFNPFLFLSLSDTERSESQIKYQFNKTGVFLEGNFEYDLPLARGFRLNLWAKGNWMHFRGNGRAGYTLDIIGQDALLLQVFGFTILDLQGLFSANVTSSESAEGSFNIYTSAIGVSAIVSF